MPVSTFSAASSAVRTHGRSNTIERWTSTRERIRDDERRQSLSEINEMDGTGLYERGDWPMRVSGEEGRRVSVSDGRRGSEDWRDGDHHIMDVGREERGLDAEWVVERDVSDIDEEEDVHAEEEALEQRLRAEGLVDKRHSVILPVQEPEMNGVRDGRTSGREDGVSPQEGASDRRYSVQQSERSGVSPEQDDAQEAQRWSSRQEAQTNGDAHALESGLGHAELAEQDDDLSDLPDTSTNGQDYDPEEERDIATPIPSQWHAESPDPEIRQRTSPRTNGRTTPTPSHTRSSSIPNGQATPPIDNAHARQSSIAKEPLSGTASRRSSASHNPYNTTQISNHKGRVRYSWQSLADDEPNRPRIHIIKLVSNTATSSAGFPQGEAFGFSISPGGRRIAAYNSARLYVLQTAALPVGISQDYALKRRPLAVEIVDEGDMLAILADQHTVNIYDLSHHRLRRSKTIKLDYPTTCIALAPMGGLLAAAYEGGVEIFSLHPNALPTDRRAVRSQKMDKLTFSEDGSTLLGTTTRINASSTVVVNVPVFPSAPNGVPTHEELKEAWCSDLLHPENIRNSSHATFMRENRITCNERLFAWNGHADTFGILNTTDMQYGHIDFPVVIAPPLSTCGGLGAAIHSCPALDEHGDTVAMIVNDRTIRLYIVPHKAEEGENTVEAHSIDHELDEGYGCPFSEVRWVYSHASLPAPLSNQTQVQGRLIVTSPGGVVDPSLPEESVVDVEGGRIILFDFDPQFAGQPGQTFSLTLGKSPPQTLEEATFDVADEVAIVRRRTVNQSKSGTLSQRPITLGRAATTFGSGRNGIRTAGAALQPDRSGSVLSVRSMNSEAARSLPDLLESNEAATDTFLEPFSNTAPRSQASLQRAATNAQRHRFQTLEERNNERISTDSNGNFLPLPEYTEEPNAPLPSRFRAMAGLDAPRQPPPRPSIVTSNSPSATAAPMTAPANLAENFSAEQAFAAAVAASPLAQTALNRPMPQPMPRSLQRAYSNAVSPLGSGPPPSLIGDWENVSPIRSDSHRSNLSPITSNGTLSPSGTHRSQDPDMISPVSAPTNASATYRYSTSLVNPPGQLNHQSSRPTSSAQMQARAPSAASSYATPAAEQSFAGVSTSRRMPPHMQAFRNAASAQASLFPTTQSHDHVPLPPPQPAGSFTHPVTAWHPPAPGGRGLGSRQGHSRNTSAGSRSAFASTSKAKRLGFFKRGKQVVGADGQVVGANGGRGGGWDDGRSTAGRSVMTWMTGGTRRTGNGEGEGKCAVM